MQSGHSLPFLTRGRFRPWPHVVQHLTHRGTHIPEPSLPPPPHVLGGHGKCLHSGLAKQTAAPRHGLKPHSHSLPNFLSPPQLLSRLTRRANPGTPFELVT